MRVLVFFDIPVKSKQNRKNASAFRTMLIKEGYVMTQYSVYTKICSGLDSAKRAVDNLKRNLPSQGNIRALIITEKQWADMQLLIGTPSIQETKVSSEQISIF